VQAIDAGLDAIYPGLDAGDLLLHAVNLGVQGRVELADEVS
jgi:hypothetical protein